MPTSALGNVEFDLLLAICAAGAGCIGAMVGLGGGIFLVPLLTLAFGVDIRVAMGASLVAVIGTSTGAAAVRGTSALSNQRVALVLEVAATIGAVVGALLMTLVRPGLLLILFGAVLLLTAALSARRDHDSALQELPPNDLARRLRLDGTVDGPDGPRPYHVQRPVAGIATMTVAGVVSGLLGIGSGVLKVLAMDTFMRMPFRVSTVTSNFMVGLTAAASVGVYWSHGVIDPHVAGASLVGVVPGAMLGSWLVHRVDLRLLRLLFLLALVGIAIQMIVQGVRDERAAASPEAEVAR
jgi:uncharacterized membrane protein YfcA